MDRRGVLYALGAYLCWGFFPIYWRLLKGVPALEILAHRMTWSLVFLGLLLLMRRQWRWILPALRDKKTLLTFMLSATLLSLNWWLYIWAVNAGFIVETSLGYFINPLVNVLLGVIFLKERLRRAQALSVLVAVGGVLYLTLSYGRLPWIALALGVSFAIYGLLRKMASLNSLEGLSFEAALLSVPAVGFLLWLELNQQGSFGHADAKTNLLLVGAGIATAVPLLLFAAGARRIPLVTVGILQYLAPSIQLAIGVLIYHEPFDRHRLLGFGLVWLALLLYSGEGVWRWRQQRQVRRRAQVPVL